MSERLFSDPFPGAERARDMESRDNAVMQPTPPQPHLAHCCACNEREITAADERQRVDQAGRRYEQNQADFQIVVQAAVKALDEQGAPRSAAEDFLTKVFERFAARIDAAELPTFR